MRLSTKLGALIAALRRSECVTLAELMDVAGCQAHSVRGGISGSLKKLKLEVTSEVIEGPYLRKRGGVHHLITFGNRLR